MASPKQPAVLDGPGIRRLRYLRGYSIRDVARRLGVSATAVSSLEAGRNHAELPLRLVDDLARLLGVATVELFKATSNAPPAPTRDDQAIEAALAITRSATSTTDLAIALDWDLARVRKALRQLGERQAETGIRLHDHGWQRHALLPASEYLSDEQQVALQRIGPRHRGLTVQTASLLAEIAQGDVPKRWRRGLSASQHAAFQSLLKQRLVEVTGDGDIAISATVRLGFYPEQDW